MQEKRQNSIARNCDHEMEEEMRENGLRMDDTLLQRYSVESQQPSSLDSIYLKYDVSRYEESIFIFIPRRRHPTQQQQQQQHRQLYFHFIYRSGIRTGTITTDGVGIGQ
eukprot:scaffold128_cov140-Skeletonema_menzelii.AAC.19